MRSAKRSSSDYSVKFDPIHHRPANADESVPEALVPDVVHTALQQSAPEPAPSRWQRIAHRAYELAQQRGFMPGAELGDWLQAEKEIDDAAQQQAAPEDQFTG
jgi:hypothetical protein